MSSGRYPSSSERKQYTEEEEKLLTWIRQCRSQPITYGESFFILKMYSYCLLHCHVHRRVKLCPVLLV